MSLFLQGKVAKFVAPSAIIVNSPQTGDDFTDDEERDTGTKIVEAVTKPVVRFCAYIMKVCFVETNKYFFLLFDFSQIYQWVTKCPT